jgi:transglutaminase-like putative cysteine protease
VFWRATTLDEYTGYGWEETRLDRDAIGFPGYPWQRIESRFGAGAVRDVVAAQFDPLLPDAARKESEWTRQHVTVAALADTHLVAAAEPVLWQVDVDHAVRTAPGGPVLQRRGLRPDQEYTVWSYTADVQPKELAELPVADRPGLEPFLEVLPGITFPAFGEKNRDAKVERLFDEIPLDVLRAHEPLYAKARELVGDTTSPYLAAATLEAWFRSSGEFRYELQPGPVPGSTPPLVDFVLRGKEGYCQHFAGAMALMLRMLGIPARVGAGFVTGTWDARHEEWVVTDHDAHTWVEVYFPSYGWLTFNPTPERGDLSASYSTTSSSFPDEDVSSLGIDPNALSAALLNRLGGLNASGAFPSSADTGSAAGEEGGGLSTGALVACVVAALVVFLWLLKATRRRLRFVGGGPRRVAGACRRDLVAFLADQRVSVSPSATLDEIGTIVRVRFSVSAAPFVRAVSAARFGPPGEADAAARRARSELRALERELRREISAAERARGALSFRSLLI